MKVLTISPFKYGNQPYRGIETTLTGDPVTYHETSGIFIDDLIMALRNKKLQGIKLKPVELNFEVE